jgi:hypothetical protein
MATGIVLHPLAQRRLKELKAALEADFGLEASERTILSAAVHGATAPALVGMHAAFVKARNAHDAARRAQPPPAAPAAPGSS